MFRNAGAAAWLAIATIGALVPGPASGVDTVFDDAKLIASDGAAYDNFGFSVAVDGDIAVVGAPVDDDRATGPGAAYVYHWNGTDWTEEAKLTASDGADDDYFGFSVAVAGDAAVISAWGRDDKGVNSGAAYVYGWNGTDWVEEAKLRASDGARSDQFGRSVAISGDVVVVGAHLEDGKGDNSGSAYVFGYDGMNWVEEMKLLASDGAAGDFLGDAVAIAGETVVIGAPGEDEKGGGSGATYVFRYDGMDWVEETKLLASDGAAADGFGRSVAVSGDTALVGAWQDQDSGFNTGSAYVYQYDGMDWVEEMKLLASDGAAGDFFGRRVALSGDTAVIGAWRDDDNGTNSGSAYVYQYDGTDWIEAKLLASDGALGDFFGSGVAVSGGTAVVGAKNDDDACADQFECESGAAYVYFLPEPADWILSVVALATFAAYSRLRRTA
jgi:hypothetical protein